MLAGYCLESKLTLAIKCLEGLSVDTSMVNQITSHGNKDIFIDFFRKI